ncbi:MAG: ABC transporter permease subunit [Gammaproteobacteria bacterium]|nr:ABC transporter permease subunit [Gammaproteobacteria bacterium]
MAVPYAIGQPIDISLAPQFLPGYAMRTVFRMFIALFFSIIVSMILGAWAAKNRKAEQIIIPAIDVLQAVPVLSFLALTVTGFIHLFPGSLLGPECASIFVIFTAQVWNIIFSFYQSLKMIPHDLKEASSMFQLTAWKNFWRIEVPFAIPGLLWNMMISMSASWFFVVLSEAISVSHQQIRLPGIGSYIALAIEQSNMLAVGYAIVTMVVVIFLYDQLLFRPLIAWSEKFRMEPRDEEYYQSWLVDWIYQSSLHAYLEEGLIRFRQAWISSPFFNQCFERRASTRTTIGLSRYLNLWQWIISILVLASIVISGLFIWQNFEWNEVLKVAYLGAITAFRVIILIALSSLIWIPVGVAIGMRSHLAQSMQPVIQFLAAFPANLFYPLFVVVIVKFSLNPEIWLTPLMILGTQWYILFNVIAGTTMIPADFKLLTANYQVTGWVKWRRLILPAIFPYFVTGAVTAAGGAWNASIVAECVGWGSITLKATGLGEYIQAQTISGDFNRLVLGTLMMCLYVLLFNHLIWRPMYRFAQERFCMH